MYVLGQQIIDQHSAVEVFKPRREAVLLQEILEDVMAHRAEIAGKDRVVVVKIPPRVVKMGKQRIVGRRGHGRAHVVGVGHTRVHHAAERHMGDVERPAVAREQHRPRARDRPLGGRRALSSVFQRKAVLTLRRTEVGAGEGEGRAQAASVQQKGGQGEALRHGGAGAVEPEIGHSPLLDRESGADALVQKIPA